MLLRGITIAALVLALAAWIAVGAAFLIGAEGPVRIGLIAAAVILTEVFAWLATAVLGVSLMKKRKDLWRRLTGRPPAPDEGSNR